MPTRRYPTRMLRQVPRPRLKLRLILHHHSSRGPRLWIHSRRRPMPTRRSQLKEPLDCHHRHHTPSIRSTRSRTYSAMYWSWWARWSNSRGRDRRRSTPTWTRCWPATCSSWTQSTRTGRTASAWPERRPSSKFY